MEIKNLLYGALCENVVAKAVQLKIGQPHHYITSIEDKITLQVITCVAATSIGFFVGYIAMVGAFTLSVTLIVCDDIWYEELIDQANEQTTFQAAKNMNWDFLRDIRSRNPNFQKIVNNSLFEAIKQSDKDAFKRLIESGASIKARKERETLHSYAKKYYKEKNPTSLPRLQDMLIYLESGDIRGAIFLNDPELVRAYLQLGADLSKTDDRGNTVRQYVQQMQNTRYDEPINPEILQMLGIPRE